MSLQPLLVLLLVIKFGCMVNMGNSSSSNTRSSREDYNNTNTNSIFNDTSISDVSIACIKSHLNSGIPAKEFMRLEREAPFLDAPITEAHRSCNKDKNRYVNILPCDSTRVRLAAVAGVEGSDYINANFIAGDDTDRAYIATQGPLMHTRGDFWRMVWENNTTIVVMLGKERENERVKVDRYWPEEDEDEGEGERGLQFQQLRVTLLDKRYDDDKHIAVRRLCISLLPPDQGNTNHSNPYNNNSHNQHNHHPQQQQQQQPICSRQVLHYQYEGWPDHGVPPSAAPIRKLVHMIEHERTQMQIPHPSPIVVHCSAGVGRTGTFVTIHMTLLRLFHALRDSGNNPFQNLNHSTNSLHGSTQSLNSSASSLHESTNSLHSSSGSLYGSTSSLNSLNGSSNSVHGQSNHSTATNIALTAKFNLYDTVLKLRKQRPGMVQQQEQYVFCYEAVAEEAEHLGLIPADPPSSSSSSSSRRAPRTLSISTSSLPSPSPESTTTLRTSSSSYVSSPTSVPPSPTFLDSSYFLNSSTSSLPSPPASPYIYPSLDYNTPSLFPPPGHTSPPHISSHSSPSHPSHPSPSHPSHSSHSSHDPSCMFPLPHEPLTPPVDCQK